MYDVLRLLKDVTCTHIHVHGVVGVVTTYIRASGNNTSLSLQDLSHKLAMLMALTRPSRSADVAKLDLQFRSYSVEGVTFQSNALSKQSRQQKHRTEFFFPYSVEGVTFQPNALSKQSRQQKHIE